MYRAVHSYALQPYTVNNYILELLCWHSLAHEIGS